MTFEEAIQELEWIYQNGFENDIKIIGTDRILDAIRMGIEGIEKQIPKKPAEYTLHTESDEEVHYEGCPSCKAILNKSHYFLKICHCGQKLDV